MGAFDVLLVCSENRCLNNNLFKHGATSSGLKKEDRAKEGPFCVSCVGNLVLRELDLVLIVGLAAETLKHYKVLIYLIKEVFCLLPFTLTVGLCFWVGSREVLF